MWRRTAGTGAAVAAASHYLLQFHKHTQQCCCLRAVHSGATADASYGARRSPSPWTSPPRVVSDTRNPPRHGTSSSAKRGKGKPRQRADRRPHKAHDRAHDATSFPHTTTETVSSLELDPNARQNVLSYLRAQQKHSSTTTAGAKAAPPPPLPSSETTSFIKGTTLKTVSITFPVGPSGRVVTATGISKRKRTAAVLCYMHAARLIDYHTVDLPQWERAASPTAPRTAASSSPPSPTPPPRPPKALKEEVIDNTSGMGSAAALAIPRPPNTLISHSDAERRHCDADAWEAYVVAAGAHARKVRDLARATALQQLRLPPTEGSNAVVSRASAIVEEHAPITTVAKRGGGRRGGAAVRKQLTDSETRARNALNAIMRDVHKNYNVVRCGPGAHLCTLALDRATGATAMGVGPSAKIATARCAMHALCIVDLLKSDQAPRAAGGLLGAETAQLLFGRGGGGASTLPGVSAASISSAPLKSIVDSLSPRYAKMYGFLSTLFEDERPATTFSRDERGLYVCRLTLNDVECHGTGVNRFEAERAAVEVALSEMELYDERLQEIDAFMTAHPHISPDAIPAVRLPEALRHALHSSLIEIREQLGMDAEEGGTPRSAAHGDGATQATMSEEEAVMARQLLLRRTAAAAAAARRSAGDGPTPTALRMQQRLEALRADPVYVGAFHPRRSTLAMATVEDEIVRTVADNRVTIVCGTTGCGKTTQVPQYLLDAAIRSGAGDVCNIIVTQPRRLTAFSVADRIAQERLSSVGDDVGYIVRLDARPGKHITLCTSGVLVQMLGANPTLEGVTHLILDEVHERDINGDVLLSLGKQLLQVNPDIRLILMSATMQAGLFQSYFSGAPIISVEGAVYPVTVHYLDDIAAAAGAAASGATTTTTSPSSPPAFYSPMFDLVDRHSGRGGRRGSYGGRYGLLTPPKTDYHLIAYLVHRSIHADMAGDVAGKSVLVFLPGWKELLAAKQAIESYRPHRDSFGGGGATGQARGAASPVAFHFIPLHSTVEAAKQRECFRPAPPGHVKVVLATNIAESGITIDDAAVVIDTGLIKQTSWVSPTAPSSQAFQYIAESGDGDGDGGTTPSTAAPAAAATAVTAAGFSTQLSLQYASRANATQRKGRAGRTQGGVCYRLLTRATWEALPAHPVAEIHRVPLTQVLLRLLSLRHADPKATLQAFIEPPSPSKVAVSMSQLMHLDAVTADEKLTALGQYLARLPCDPRVGKMIMLGAVLHCMDSVLTVAATTDACPFVTSRDVAAAVRRKQFMFSRGSQSDHISYLNAYNAFCRNGGDAQFAHFNHLHVARLHTIAKYKQQYTDILRRSGLITAAELRPTRQRGSSTSLLLHRSAAGPAQVHVDDSLLSRDAQDVALVKACICASLFPNVAVLDASTSGTGQQQQQQRLASKMARNIKLRTKTLAAISPSGESACRRVGGPREHGVPTTEELMREVAPAATATEATLRTPAMYYIYQDVFTVKEANKSFLTSVSSVSLWALLLFGASDAKMTYHEAIGVCVVDDWLPVRIDRENFRALHTLKKTLHACVWAKYRDPLDAANNTALDTLRRLCKDVLKAPLDVQEDLAVHRLVDSGDIVSPFADPTPMEVSGDSAAAAAFEAPPLTPREQRGAPTGGVTFRDIHDEYGDSDDDDDDILF